MTEIGQGQYAKREGSQIDRGARPFPEYLPVQLLMNIELIRNSNTLARGIGTSSILDGSDHGKQTRSRMTIT